MLFKIVAPVTFVVRGYDVAR